MNNSSVVIIALGVLGVITFAIILSKKRKKNSSGIHTRSSDAGIMYAGSYGHADRDDQHHSPDADNKGGAEGS